MKSVFDHFCSAMLAAALRMTDEVGNNKISEQGNRVINTMLTLDFTDLRTLPALSAS